MATSESNNEIQFVDESQIAREMFPNQVVGFPVEYASLDEVKLPHGDDLGIHSDDDIMDDENENNYDSGFHNFIVVLGLPVAPKEKVPRLTQLITQLFINKYGKVAEDGLQMPLDEKGKTKGFAFIELQSREEAISVKQNLNEKKFDNNHTFQIFLLSEIDNLENVPEDFDEPTPQPFKDSTTLHSWLHDSFARQQYLVLKKIPSEKGIQKHSSIFWLDPRKQSQDLQVFERMGWTDVDHIFSPKGNFVLTFHQQGVKVWGGKDFQAIRKFSHMYVTEAFFSPNERYMITFSSSQRRVENEYVHWANFYIFDVYLSELQRAFQAPMKDFVLQDDLDFKLPIFKFSGSRDGQDKYFARLQKNQVNIYQCSNMTLLDKKPMKLENVLDFSWSPVDSLLATFQGDQGNHPAKISVWKIPEKVEIATKSMYGVKDIQFHWQSQGRYLAIQHEYSRKKKGVTNKGFELIRLSEKVIPIEELRLTDEREPVQQFQWEPQGSRFAILHGENPREQKLSIYSMEDKSKSCKKLVNLEKLQISRIEWSPKGKYLVLASLAPGYGESLIFYNVDELSILKDATTTQSSIVWDPSGRYVASIIQAKGGEGGITFFTATGYELYTTKVGYLEQFMWRPMPPQILNEEQEKAIQRTVRQQFQRFEELDDQVINTVATASKQQRENAYKRWLQIVENSQHYQQKMLEFKKQIHGDKFQEIEYTNEDVEVEFIIDSKEEPY